MRKILLILLCLVGCKEKNPHHLVKVGPSHYATPDYYADELTHKKVKDEWASYPKDVGYQIEIDGHTYISRKKPEVKNGVWSFMAEKYIECSGDVVCTQILLIEFEGKFLTKEQFEKKRHQELKPQILEEVIDKYGDGQ